MLMIAKPPRSTPNDTFFPHTTLFPSNRCLSLRGAGRRSKLQSASCLAVGWRGLPLAFAGGAMTPYGCGRDNRRSSSGRRCRKGRASTHATLRSPPRLTIHVMLYYYKPWPDLTLRGTFANFRAADEIGRAHV